MIFDTSFSLAGFWIGVAGLALTSVVVLTRVLRWMKMGKDRERSRLVVAFSLGVCSVTLLGAFSVWVYFPFCYWLAGQLGL